MGFRVRAPVRVRPWVDHVAGYIHDPVARLRFLKAVAPVLPDDRSLPPRMLRVPLYVAVALLLAALCFTAVRLLARPHVLAPRPRAAVAPPVKKSAGSPDVWLVERAGEWETYSNGLRVDSHFQAAAQPRSYLAFSLARGQAPERRTQPAGMVFHATESQQAPFEARENGVLKRIGESLLEYVRRRRAYNFVIDRFGRVYRVVPEEQAANHAGHSLWADERCVYLDLNQSFLGISFEAASESALMSPAQIRSATMLVELLRSRYRIPASNCVTHSQVSVNPTNMRIGYHVDWASGFPYEALGLPDNYVLPLPSVWQFGFEPDAAYRAAACPRLLTGVDAAEALLMENAAAAELRPAAYRKSLRQRYHAMIAVLVR